MSPDDSGPADASHEALRELAKLQEAANRYVRFRLGLVSGIGQLGPIGSHDPERVATVDALTSAWVGGLRASLDVAGALRSAPSK